MKNFNDVKLNLMFSKYSANFCIKDPFEKKPFEDAMTKLGAEFVKSYWSEHGLYIYSIKNIKGDKNETLRNILKELSKGKPVYHFKITNELTKKKEDAFVRQEDFA